MLKQPIATAAVIRTLVVHGNTLEGWGIRSFQFTPGSASPAPLTLRLTADKSRFEGVLVTKATSDGLWSVTDLDFVNNVATGLVPNWKPSGGGFGGRVIVVREYNCRL